MMNWNYFSDPKKEELARKIIEIVNQNPQGIGSGDLYNEVGGRYGKVDIGEFRAVASELGERRLLRLSTEREIVTIGVVPVHRIKYVAYPNR